MPTGMTTLRSGYRGPQAGRPPQAPWGWQGERDENAAELGVSFGPNPGAIVHFSTSSVTRPPKRIAARAASQRLPPWPRNCAITLEILVATLLVPVYPCEYAKYP